ncbi:unnamed protein product [Effrenium voratum]|uniref:Uncharacterized protein n=1 Tax=Effrenium voratum TaxID=2562239 RepID=A0AA36MSS7_9DINO|nr:unnamed protein product [Effrenium voratum]
MLRLVTLSRITKSHYGLIVPLTSGWECADGRAPTLAASEKPIAQAILQHIWNEARAGWDRQMAANLNAVAATAAAASSGSAPAASPAADDRVPKQLPANVWSSLNDYQSQQIGGFDRVFPVNELLGAERIVARVCHEHVVSENYGPIHLGEIVAARTFSASGEPNPLAKKDRAATTLTVTGDKLVSAPEELWSPRSVLSVIDGLNSICWCMILLKFGSEQVTHAFFDWLVKMARSRPQKTEQFGQFWLTVAWKLATELRGGQTFDAAVAPIMRDYDTFTECMSREPQSTLQEVHARLFPSCGRRSGRNRGPRASWAQSEPNAARWSSEAKPDWATQLVGGF